MDTAKLREALAEADRGLRETSAQFEVLRLQKQQLEAVVASMNALLGVGEPTAVSTLPPPVPLSEQAFSGENSSKLERSPLWKTARELLAEADRLLTVPEMAHMLKGRGQTVHSDGLRVAMLRRPDVFFNPKYGKYGLKVWEPVYRELAEEHALEEAYSYNRESSMEDTRIA